MSRLPFAPLFFVAISLSARADAPPALTSDSAPPADAPAPHSDRPHALSSATSARVTGALPRFTSPEARASESRAAPPADLREVDRPRNAIPRLSPALFAPAQPTPGVTASLHLDQPPPDGVLRLPTYDVRDRKYPALKNRELLTPEAKIDLQFKKHPGLHLGNFFGLNRGIAAGMAAEEDAYERRMEMADLLDLQRFADAHPAHDPDADAAPASTQPVSTPAPAATK